MALISNSIPTYYKTGQADNSVIDKLVEVMASVNLILEKSKFVDYYTYLDELFREVPEFREYHWLISDLEFNHCEDARLQTNPVVIDGEALAR